jgi:hypothetical protein
MRRLDQGGRPEVNPRGPVQMVPLPCNMGHGLIPVFRLGLSQFQAVLELPPTRLSRDVITWQPRTRTRDLEETVMFR